MIHAQERAGPQGREKIDWKLITNLPVRSRNDALEKLSWYGRTQEWEDPGRHQTVGRPLPLPSGHRPQRHNLLRVFGTTGAALPPAWSHSDSTQRVLPQGRRRMEVVRRQSTLAGGSSTPAVLARVEYCRAALAAHMEEWDSQSVLRNRSGTGRRPVEGLQRDAITPGTDPLVSPPFLLTHMSCYLCAAVYRHPARTLIGMHRNAHRE
jgi:hypothetical protein